MTGTMFTIEAQTRDTKSSNDFLRSNGSIPAVVYGGGTETRQISVVAKEFEKIFKGAGESSTVTISLDGKKIDTLIHEVQFDAVTNRPMHVDFLAIDTSKPITVSVPLEFTGAAPAVKAGLGTLVKIMHEIEISALPKDMPHSIVVDISSLNSLESQLNVSNLTFPSGVTPTAKGTDIVASIAAQKEEKEEAPIDLSTIEVEKKGKKEEEAPSKE
jgi:large subunit ribosomal protein L25